MHRQIRDKEIFFLWKIKPYGSYTNQIHRGMVFNTYTWTKINTRHIRPGWIMYSSFPFPPSVGKIQHGHHFTKGNVISNFFCFCSVETLYLQQNSQHLDSSQCGSEKWQSPTVFLLNICSSGCCLLTGKKESGWDQLLFFSKWLFWGFWAWPSYHSLFNVP